MSKTIISEGKTTAEAIEKGLKELKISKDEAEIKVLEEKKKSFFSILDPHVVKVEITAKCDYIPDPIREENREIITFSKEQIETVKKQLSETLKELFANISDKITYTIESKEDYISVILKGEDSTRFIGYRGEALNALQLVITNIIKNKTGISAKIIIDIEQYREKRKQTLEELATKIEKTVAKTGKKITLEPMSSYDRKIIHTALQNSQEVNTYSIGQGDNRRIVVSKK